MTQIKIIKGSAGLGAGPLYEKVYEDHVGDAYDHFLSVQGVDGNDYTYRQSFNDDRQGWTVEAGETVARILNEVGIIDLPYWELGTPWDQYKIPQTYEEEKRDALESEHGY
jgi:hypothetical protein